MGFCAARRQPPLLSRFSRNDHAFYSVAVDASQSGTLKQNGRSCVFNLISFHARFFKPPAPHYFAKLAGGRVTKTEKGIPCCLRRRTLPSDILLSLCLSRFAPSSSFYSFCVSISVFSFCFSLSISFSCCSVCSFLGIFFYLSLSLSLVFSPHPTHGSP